MTRMKKRADQRHIHEKQETFSIEIHGTNEKGGAKVALIHPVLVNPANGAPSHPPGTRPHINIQASTHARTHACARTHTRSHSLTHWKQARLYWWLNLGLFIGLIHEDQTNLSIWTHMCICTCLSSSLPSNKRGHPATSPYCVLSSRLLRALPKKRWKWVPAVWMSRGHPNIHSCSDSFGNKWWDADGFESASLILTPTLVLAKPVIAYSIERWSPAQAGFP